MIDTIDVKELIVYREGVAVSTQDLSELLDRIKQTRTKFDLVKARIIYQVNKEQLFKDWLGKSYETFEEWGIEVLERKRAMVYGLAKVYEVFVVTHAVDIDRLCNIESSKLIVASPFVTDTNVEEILKLCENNTLYNLQNLLRQREKPEVFSDSEDSGSGESSNSSDQPEKKTVKKFSFDVTELQAQTVDDALRVAEELVGSDVPGKKWEYICADFLNSASCETRETHLEDQIKLLERVFDVKITVESRQPITLEGSVNVPAGA